MIKFSDVGKGTYAAVTFTESSLDAIQDLQLNLGLLNPVPRDKLHSTITYSRVKIPYLPYLNEYYIANSGRLDIWDTQNGDRALVLKLDSESLKERHKYSRALGATYDFEEYLPHVTLSYNIGAQKINISDINIGPLFAKNEYTEDLNLDWKPEK